jgi:hypothetical protein
MNVVALAERARRRLALRRLLVWGVPLLYLAVLALFIAREGIPLSRDTLVMWILLGLLALSVTNFRRWASGVVFEWLPFLVILWLYDLLRGQADGLLFRTHVYPQLDAEKFVFGGTEPTVWLQNHLWHGGFDLRWWDFGSWFVYVSYFLGTYIVAGALWFFAHEHFRRYVATVSLLALMGFTTYALFPAAPPWMASELGAMEPTTRSIGIIWSHIPIAHFNDLFEKGSQYANSVAAVPSLHAAYTLLIALSLWRFAPWWGRVLLTFYPWAMAFALVYTSEHYFVDILLGWIYCVVAYLVVNRVAQRISARGTEPAVAT